MMGHDALGPAGHCRVCGGDFFAAPLLTLRDMPKAAQNFPDADTLADDRGEDLTIAQCADCALVQLTNPPVPYYRDVIRAAAFSPEMRDYRRTQFRDFVARHGLKGRRVLELGCGQGEFLGLMREAGAVVSGIEHLPASVAACKADGLDVMAAYPDQPDLALPGAPLDAFFIMNFFEHLPDPNLALAVVHRNLADDGIGLVEVPNFDMILRQRLFSEFINDHLFYFTAATLTATLERNGFEVMSCESTWYDYILSATVRKRAPMDLGELTEFQAVITAELHRFLDDCTDQRVAVWGAGHQALAVIALTGIGPRLHCVLDSATFKQDRFTPATHLPILAPEKLAAEDIDVIIVMAASYSDEVAGIIRERHGDDVRVAILRDHGLEHVA